MQKRFSEFVGKGGITKSRLGDVFVLSSGFKDIPRGSNFKVASVDEAVYPLVYRLGEGSTSICLFNEEVGHVVLWGDPVRIDMLFSLVERCSPKEDSLVEASRKEEVEEVEEQSTRTIGIAGPKGEKGEKGDKGDRGIAGLIGERGPVGPKGEKGDRGEQGEKGDRGEPGERGDRGEQGQQGIQGERGEQGLQGIQGIQGEIGPQGEKGDKGERGEQGPRGERGERGPQGKKGEKGDQGVQGLQGKEGEKGERGQVGPKGERGDQGPRGPEGARGPRGPQGERGDKGDAGEDGIAVAQYPLVYDKQKRSLSLDSKSLLDKLQTIFAPLMGKNFDMSKLDWLAASGGGVGVRWAGKIIRNIIGDLDFRGRFVTVKENGNGVIVDVGGSTNKFYEQPNAPTDMIAGDLWFDTDAGILYHAVTDDSGIIWVNFSNANNISNTSSVTGATYNASITDYYIGVSYDGPATVRLPSNPINGKTLVVKDESGHAGDGFHHRIEVIGSTGDMIDNHDKAIINIDNAALQFIYNNGWRII